LEKELVLRIGFFIVVLIRAVHLLILFLILLIFNLVSVGALIIGGLVLLLVFMYLQVFFRKFEFKPLAVVILRHVRRLPVFILLSHQSRIEFLNLLEAQGKLELEIVEQLKGFRGEEEPDKALVVVWNQQLLIHIRFTVNGLVLLQTFGQILFRMLSVNVDVSDAILLVEEGELAPLRLILRIRIIHKSLAIVNLTQPRSLLLFKFIPICPHTLVEIEFIMR